MIDKKVSLSRNDILDALVFHYILVFRCEKNVKRNVERNDAAHGRRLMNEVVKIGSYEDADNYGSEKRSKDHSSTQCYFPASAPFQHAVLPSNPLGFKGANNLIT